MSDHPPVRLPWNLRALNHAAALAARVGLSPAPLQLDAMLAEARARTGLEDFGDEAFLEPLALVLRCAQEEGRVSLTGFFTLKLELERLLDNRLRLQAWLAEHPEALEQPPARPLFILGLPRTGTTLLLNLLSRHPEARALWLPELMHPTPLETPGARERAAQDYVNSARDRVPKLFAAHPMDPEWPEECLWLFEHELASVWFDAVYDFPSYRDWMLGLQWGPACRAYRQMLQVLQHQDPRPYWVLKAPSHIFRLEELAEAFPDARFVWNHRDPLRVVPSCMSLYEIGRAAGSETTDLRGLGGAWMTLWGEGIRRAVQARARIGEERFFDLPFGELVKDPLGTVERIHRHFELPWSDAAHQAMARWMQENPRHKHGKHDYSLERYGVSEGDVQAQLEPYIERFGALFSGSR
ncbi:MAG: sulfotransferase [Alphaproteobacteria bacterium]|nr:sulfotransferase [Alphaproteobacteria bacterium]